MSTAPHTQPVIPYAETGGRKVDGRATDDGGIEFVMAPPALWRQLVGPGIVLAALTVAVPVGAALTLGILVRAGGFGGAAIWWVLTVVMLVVWALVVRSLWRVGRYGRLPSVLRASSGILHVIVPSRAQEDHRVFASVAMSSVSIASHRSVLGLLPVIRVQIVYKGGMSTEIRIPWRGGEPVEPVERRLREVLGLSTDRA